MNSELIRDFTRITVHPGETVLEVGLVRWSGPHTPELEWVVFRKWLRPPTVHQVTRALKKALGSCRFFLTCAKCGELRNRGHMHDESVCQGCSGAVY